MKTLLNSCRGVWQYALTWSFFVTLCACGGIQPDEPVNADLSVTQAPVEMSFSGAVNSTGYRSLSFTNQESHDITINNLAFANNDCGAFSVFNVVDENNNILFDSEKSIEAVVAAGHSVTINLRFSPTPCELKNYSSIFIIYYDSAGEIASRSVILNAKIEDNTATTPVADCSSSAEIIYNDELGDPTPSRKLPALPEGENYYLKIERMRAFIQPTGGFASLATKVGSDINVEQVDEDKRFTSVFLPMTSDGQGHVNILQINECSNFSLPAPVSDPYFIGASVALTTPGPKDGTIEISDTAHLGELNVNDLEIELFSFINNSSSLLQSAQGTFRVSIVVDLTTGTTAPNALLQDISDEVDDEGLPLFNLVGSGANMSLRGKHLRHGTLTLVGVGLFTGTNAEMSDEAKKGIVENEAYIFVELAGRIVTRK